MAWSVGTMLKRETTSKKTRDSLSRVCPAMNLAKSAELQMLLQWGPEEREYSGVTQ